MTDTTLTPTQLQALADPDSGYATPYTGAELVALVQALAAQLLTTQQRLAEVEGLVAQILPHQYDIGYRSGATAERHHCWGCGAWRHADYDDDGVRYRTEPCGDTCPWRRLKEALGHA